MWGLDSARLETVGAIPGGRVSTTRAKSLIPLLTLQEKIQQLPDNASTILRLGIPAYEWWSESLHGIATNGPGINFNGTMPSTTSFHQVIVTVGSFYKTFWSKIGPTIATEARAMYNCSQAGLTFLAPTINLFRDPKWGRSQESPGEDPMLVSAYAIEYVKSFQSGKWDGEGGDDGFVFGEKRALKGEGDESDDDEGLTLYVHHCRRFDLISFVFTLHSVAAPILGVDSPTSLASPRLQSSNIEA
ncbi:hypothetical protein Patl1_28401 [Pistacia atlantica]|uniref:Uncharacterized protein n=1 Tax=Pistacia atlantica TaxID=434234 RepID=A0ACC1BCY8_9ROSI|nr:hypothetical protein Patl1_28401 [Pistacia atlantica]